MQSNSWQILTGSRAVLLALILVAFALLLAFALLISNTLGAAASSQAIPTQSVGSTPLSPSKSIDVLPTTIRATAAQQAWDQMGGGLRGQSGVLGSVVALDSSDNLYVGGNFMWAGEECSAEDGCNHIAMWDGAVWSALGKGPNGNVQALAFDAQNNLYAGGLFQFAGDCTEADGCLNVAMWDGDAWSAIGSGVGGQVAGRVHALAVDSSGNLYAGGDFLRAGECSAEDGCDNLAMWDGDAWGPVGGGVASLTLSSVNALPRMAAMTLPGGMARHGVRWTAGPKITSLR